MKSYRIKILQENKYFEVCYPEGYDVNSVVYESDEFQAFRTVLLKNLIKEKDSD